MWWRRALILTHVIRQAVRAPRERSTRWDRFWAATSVTGDGGDVLWDPSTTDEVAQHVNRLLDHANTELPVIDVGCGNGRFTRALALRFPRAIGVDLSASAVQLAERESSGFHNVSFRALDMTDPDAGRALRAEFGECNVFIRGVLHVLSAGDRRRVSANLQEVTGSAGTLLMAETNFTGSLLGYFESLGADARGIPGPLARAISAGIPRPRAFAGAELDEAFPRSLWERVLVATTDIRTVPMSGAARPDTVPGFLAVLRTGRDDRRG